MICMVTSRSSGFGAGLSCAIADWAIRQRSMIAAGVARACMITALSDHCKVLQLKYVMTVKLVHC